MSPHPAQAVPAFVMTETLSRPTISDTKRMVLLAKRWGGLHLSPDKIDFFFQRLNKRLKQKNLSDFRQYCDFLESPRGKSENKVFIEALTTHTTSFFREQKHFDWLEKDGWAEIIDQGAGKEWPLTIWSAACSSGAELYSTLISAKEYELQKKMHLRVEGHGTDLSTAILRKAQQAVYSSAEINGLSEARRRAWILQARDGSDRFRIAPELRGLARWNTINLTKPDNSGPASADLILLRNVLIYFDEKTQAQVVAALCARLRLNGVLMTGHSETLSILPDGMVQVASAIYRKQGMV